MRTIRTKVYKYSELSKEAQVKALEVFKDVNVGFGWWKHIDQDAERVGLTIHGFNIEDNYIDMDYERGADYTAAEIVKTHEAGSGTHRMACLYLETKNSDDFLDDMGAAYLEILSTAYHYKLSKEQVIQTIESNDYAFFFNGTLHTLLNI